MKYLEEKQSYIDRYDLQTIKECLKWYWDLRDGMEKHRDELLAKEPKVDFDKEVHKICSYTVNAIKIERFRRKKETIDEWIEADTIRQDKIDNTLPPENIFCDKCNSPTKVIHKTLHNAYEEEPKVLFMFECIKCNIRQAFYEDGSLWDYEKPKCPECKAVLENNYEDKDEILTVTTFCSKCSYKEVDVTDFKKDRIKRQKEEEEDKKLLVEYRTEFCYTEEEGARAVVSFDGLIALSKELKEQEKKEKDPAYKKAKKLKKLKLNQLKELVSKTIQKEGYADLQFDKPEMGRFVIIGFSASDTKDDRSEYDSANTLKKSLATALKKTNWRLMSDGINYRIGIVSGRLKAYENEDDLMKLLK